MHHPAAASRGGRRVVTGRELCLSRFLHWQGGTSDVTLASSWNPSGVPTGVNAINESGSNYFVLIQTG